MSGLLKDEFILPIVGNGITVEKYFEPHGAYTIQKPVFEPIIEDVEDWDWDLFEDVELDEDN